MALSYIRFTELDAVSSVATNDILPVVETIANINKKITIGNLNSSLPLGGDVTFLKTNSGNWQSTYNNTISNSGSWSSVYNSVRPVSASWNSVYTTVQQNSAGWESVEASVLATSGNWDSVYSSVNSTSASWNSVYTNINSTSAQYTQSFVGATATVNGVKGVVPQPLSGQQISYLRGDASWNIPTAFQADVTTSTLPVCANTGLQQSYNSRKWIFPIVDSTGMFGTGWTNNQYHFCQIRIFRPMTLTQVAAWVTSSVGGVPNEYIRVIITSNDEERNRPNLTLREIVSVPGVLNQSGGLVLTLGTPLVVEPGAIWVGSIISSGASSSTNQIFGGTYNGYGMLGALNGGVLYTGSPGQGGMGPFCATNAFAQSYNASNTAPSNWNTERALYDSTGAGYWQEGSSFSQMWMVR